MYSEVVQNAFKNCTYHFNRLTLFLEYQNKIADFKYDNLRMTSINLNKFDAI